MESKTFDGGWFTCYSDDHRPPHVHGEYGSVKAVVDLLPDGKVRLSRRTKAITPKNPKRSDVQPILETAAAHADVLMPLWETVHGKTS